MKTANQQISNAKTNTDAALKNAKHSAQAAKEQANIMKCKNGTLRPVPGFSNYCVNPAFTELISNKTGKVQEIPKDKKKYYIFNDAGSRKSISMEEIKALFPKATKKHAAEKKVSGEKKESKKGLILSLHAEKKTLKEISEQTGIAYNTVYVTIKVHSILSLHKAGKTIKQISDATGFSEKSVEWQINK